MVKREKIEVREEEKEFRQKNYPNPKDVLNSNPVCGACKFPVSDHVITGKPLIHPLLEILLCQKCYSFYGDGDFSVDEDGSDKWCRWCGQGGVIFQCSKCPSSFCKKCIKRNLPRSIMDEVTKDGWECFNCNIKPLYELRAVCWAAQKYSETLFPTKFSKRKHSDSDDDEYFPAHYPKRTGRSKPSEEEQQYLLACRKFKVFLGEAVTLADVFKIKINDIKSMKTFSSIESFEKTTDKVQSLLDGLHCDLDVISDKLNIFKEKLPNDFKQWKAEYDQKKVKENGSKTEEDSDTGKPLKKKLNKSKKKSEVSEDSEGSNEEPAEKAPKKAPRKSQKKIEANEDSEGTNDEPSQKTPKKTPNKTKKKSEVTDDSDDGSNEEPEEKSNKKTPRKSKKSVGFNTPEVTEEGTATEESDEDVTDKKRAKGKPSKAGSRKSSVRGH